MTTQLKELMILHSSPVVGDTHLRSRTETYVTGEGGVVAIERDGDTVTIRGEKRTIVVPWGVCRWGEVSQAVAGTTAPVADSAQSTPGSSPKERDMAAHGSGVLGIKKAKRWC